MRAYRKLAGGGGIPFDLPITPPLDLLRPVDSPLPTNPELVLGENDRAFVSYGISVGGFLVSTGTGGWSYSAANDITMLAAASDASLVAKTLGIDGTDTILRFPAGGGVATSTLGVSNVSHVVKNLWTTSSPSGATGPLEGENVDWAMTGWYQASPGGQRRVRGVYRDLGSVLGHQLAALDMMADFRPLVTKSGWEYGGAVCKNGQNYFATKAVTDEDGGSVGVIAQAGPICTQAGATMVADVHLHKSDGGGSPYPSGPDYQAANDNQSLTFYLSVQRPNSSPPDFWFLKYRGPGAQPLFTCRYAGSAFVVYNGILWVPCDIP